MGVVFVDIEVGRDARGAETLVCVGAWRPSDDASLRCEGAGLAGGGGAELERFLESADFIVGHNIERHDWPRLLAARPSLEPLGARVLDTLVLNPLAFPRNPYHRLVKDYKLARHALNDPVADSKVCGTLYGDQVRALLDDPPGSALYAALLGEPYAGWFRTLGHEPSLDPSARIAELVADHVCASALGRLLPSSVSNASRDERRCWAYATAWLRVAGGSSVLPGWVRHTHPQVPALVDELRGRGCDDPACTYCREHHDPESSLQRFFGFPAFRAYGDEEGEPLQRRIVRHLLERRSTVAVLPTGGGKSLCYQLPAMVFGATRGGLTVIVSPLQSLMQDQVDALQRRGYSHAASLTGRLTLPERHAVLDRIALGDVHLLFIAPEQLRNRSFTDAIGQREVTQWVVDEAHCLSKWGHDFRPDYLYIGRFIAEHTPGVPVHGFTATARPEVLEEIAEHFRRHLGVEVAMVIGGHQRSNLSYRVETCSTDQRQARVLALLEEHGEQLRRGGAIVFCARRRTTELLAQFLQDNGWSADYFHAGRRPNDKRQVQDAFIGGELDVIAATCAFGMGVDKSDVRLVIHADMPDSLENYLQEAGRAGRDGAPAHCVLLYDEKDADDQFERSRAQQITLRDFRALYRAIRERLGARRKRGGIDDAELVASAGEILRTAQGDDDAENRAGFDLNDPQFDTKVRTALAWMEECEPPLLRRRENRVGVVQGGLKIRRLDAIEAHLRDLRVPPSTRKAWIRLAELLIEASAEGAASVSADILADKTGTDAKKVYQHLQGMRDAGVLDHDVTLNAWVSRGGTGDSRARLEQLHRVEDDFVRLVEERSDLAPSIHLDVPYAAALLREMSGRAVSADVVNGVLRLWSQVDRSVAVKRVGYEQHRVVFREDWHEFHRRSAERRDVCAVELGHLLDQLPEAVTGVEVPVSFKLGSVLEALRENQATRAIVDADETRGIRAAEEGLVALQQSTVIDLEHGGAIFYPGMSLEVVPGRLGPTALEFQPLADHYAGQVRQVHIMREWAVRMADGDLEAGTRLLDDYFGLPAATFDERWFPGRAADLHVAATAARRDALLQGLTPAQRAIVEADGANMLVVAGPGSGKTKTLVHRIAWLIGVERESPSSILALTYNRSTGVELRRRLRALIGPRADHVGVYTFHALAMRIAGTPPPQDAPSDVMERWGMEVLGAATESLQDERSGSRDRFIANLQTIVVDEYQDITAERYAFLSALVGRTQRDPERRLRLLAVGDDDQNIYGWLGASNEYLHRFAQDYDARLEWLLANWRSARRIVEVSRRLIEPHPARMKHDQPLVAAREAEGLVRRVSGSFEGLANYVVTALREGDYAERTIAVLARGRRDVARWAQTLRAARLAVRAIPDDGGNLSWRALRAVDDVLSVLRHTLGNGENRSISGTALLAELTDRTTRELREHEDVARLCAAIADFARAHRDVRFPARVLWSLVAEVEAEEAAAAHRGAITVCTMHAAKGQQFDTVFVVAGATPSPGAHDSERRLHYVAATRARDELFLLEPESCHPWFGDLGVEADELGPSKLASEPERDVLLLGAGDVDLGFVGRSHEDDIAARVSRMHVGDSLTAVIHEDRYLLVDEAGVVVGRLSAAASQKLTAVTSAGWVIEQTTVRAFQRRYATQGDAAFAEVYRRDHWEAVVPVIELRRGSSGR